MSKKSVFSVLYFVSLCEILCAPLWFNVLNSTTEVTKVNMKENKGIFGHPHFWKRNSIYSLRKIYLITTRANRTYIIQCTFFAFPDATLRMV